MRPEQGRFLLALANVALALVLALVTVRTFVLPHKAGAGETPDRLDPNALQIASVGKTNDRTDQLRPGWLSLDRPKPAVVATPPPAPAGPPPIDELNQIFVVVAVARHAEKASSSVILRRRSVPESDSNAQVTVKVGEKLEDSYVLQSIDENPDRSVTVVLLNKDGKTPTKVVFKPLQE